VAPVASGGGNGEETSMPELRLHSQRHQPSLEMTRPMRK
jgi:hypothetical protein